MPSKTTYDRSTGTHVKKATEMDTTAWWKKVVSDVIVGGKDAKKLGKKSGEAIKKMDKKKK